MACIPFPEIDLPTLPDGFSLSPPALPTLDVDVNICCKQVAFPLIPPVPMPAITINPAFLAAINAAILVAKTYIAALPLKCPRN